jgi:hypothetical protein
MTFEKKKRNKKYGTCSYIRRPIRDPIERLALRHIVNWYQINFLSLPLLGEHLARTMDVSTGPDRPCRCTDWKYGIWLVEGIKNHPEKSSIIHNGSSPVTKRT